AVTLAACLGGVYASFFLDSAPAPTIVLLLTAMFLMAFFRRLSLNRRAERATATEDPART
ncbi:MAG: metal ABC transporter permease, partial [Mangrovicoccus sp.]|nr:metal ABC transporter permease [Mangrovicoccus sp.]